jgi:hypothetical protein
MNRTTIIGSRLPASCVVKLDSNGGRKRDLGRPEEVDMDFTLQIDRINNELAKAYGGGRPMAKALAASPTTKDDDNAAGEMISGDEFLEKALQAVGRKHISTAQLIEAEARINSGKRPSATVIKAVMSGTPYWPF